MSRTVHFLALLLGPLSLAAINPAPAETAPTFVLLHWTAPGDDGSLGKATRYDLRYSTQRKTVLAFSGAKAATGLPVPKTAGSQESYTLTGLSPDSNYYIGLKTLDEVGNWSAVSNIYVRSTGVLAVGDDPSVVAFAEPWPNPARGSVQLSYSLPQGGETQTRVYDITGRSVRVLESGWHAAGMVPLAWDLRDEQGHRVPTGVYLIAARAPGRQWTRRVSVIQ